MGAFGVFTPYSALLSTLQNSVNFYELSFLNDSLAQTSACLDESAILVKQAVFCTATVHSVHGTYSGSHGTEDG